jgi:hypothetical protein
MARKTKCKMPKPRLKNKITCNLIRDFIKDEQMASEQYAVLGRNELSNDEHRHHQYWLSQAKIKNCPPFE